MDREKKSITTDANQLSHNIYNDKEFAESYSNKIEYNSHNALYERPAVVSLIGDPVGKKILDAGCGPGVLASFLADKGAFITAVDYSSEMIRLTNDRVENKARVLELNLNEPLDVFKDEEFDIIVSSLTIHYLKNLRLFLSECNRILKEDGCMVFSTHHPFMDFSFHSEGNYFETELLTDEWPSYNIKMDFYRRSLSDIFNLIMESEFVIEELAEPMPVSECKEKFPDAYETLTHKPWFIIFKIKKQQL
ncbi:MAG TPA: class I SAM-dependent methyltransferase [Ignavibacteria bacterium]|nr:class I SAM-dependent methyltransferase [Ignavibacteria bacterium]